MYLDIHISYSFSLTCACASFYLCKPPDKEMYRSPVCTIGADDDYCSSVWMACTVLQLSENVGNPWGEAHTHPQLQPRTDSQPLCSSAGQPTQSSAKPRSPTPAPARYIAFLQLWASTNPSIQFPAHLCYLKAEKCKLCVWVMCSVDVWVLSATSFTLLLSLCF